MASGWGWWGIKRAGVRSGVTDRSSGSWGAICERIFAQILRVCVCVRAEADSPSNLYSEILQYQSRKHSAGLQLNSTPQNPQPLILRYA